MTLIENKGLLASHFTSSDSGGAAGVQVFCTSPFLSALTHPARDQAVTHL
jgi:hypothetical protein